MSINLTLRSFDRGIDDVRKGADRLGEDKSRIDARVRGFLGSGWSGVAADSFVEAWDDWKSAADDVHEALTAMGELLVVTRDDFIQQDDASQQRSDEVAARTVDRRHGRDASGNVRPACRRPGRPRQLHGGERCQPVDVAVDAMRLQVEAGAYDSAADALFSANDTVAAAYRTLTGKLGGYHALGGDDASSEEFVAGYDDAAATAVQAMAGLVEALGNVGTAAAGSGHNHRRANANSVYRRHVDAGKGNDTEAETVGTFTPPSALGGDNADMPDWWDHVVDHLQGWGWPSANTGQLRDAAAAWRTAAGSVDAISYSVESAKSLVRAQRSPEVDTAVSVLSELRSSADDLAAEMRNLGDACEDHATQVDQTRQTIKDLLKDLAIECGVTAGISVGLSFVTFGGAAAVGAGVIAARAIRYAKLILAALRGLRAARAVGKIAVAAPELKRVKDALEKFKKARRLADTYRSTRQGQRIGREALDIKQARNLKRFEKKLPGGAENTAISKLPNGTTQFTSNVPGRVPGSYAEYTKVVDGAGNTVKYIKPTYGPDGKIIHIKDKLGG